MSVNKTLEERGARYGRFADHAKIAQSIQEVYRAMPSWNNMDYDMRQALSVIADKIARMGNGDPFYIDNWHDIAGYATLVETRLQGILDDEKEASLYPEEKVIAVKAKEAAQADLVKKQILDAMQTAAVKQVKERTAEDIRKALSTFYSNSNLRFKPPGFA